jgi:hypothetical protein
MKKKNILVLNQLAFASVLYFLGEQPMTSRVGGA